MSHDGGQVCGAEVLFVWEEDLSAHARLSDAVCLNGVCGRQRERNERLCRRLENP